MRQTWASQANIRLPSIPQNREKLLTGSEKTSMVSN